MDLEVPDYIVTAIGSGGTQSGLEVGVRRWWPNTRAIGISVSRDKAFFMDRISRLANEAADLLEWSYRIRGVELWIEDDYVGPGYGMPSQGSVAAIKLLADMESVFLDPVYTGKAMDGLIDLVKKGAIEKGKRVLFLHTGGQPSLFAFADALADKG
jgi:D-cysteine desulfhydrase